MSEGLVDVSIIIVCILIAAAVSKRIENTIITLPMIYVALGLLLSDMGLNIISMQDRGEWVPLLAEVTLVLVLASDASRINVPSLIRQHSLPLRLLSIGLPLTMILGTVAAALFFTDLSLAEAAILGILLAPTDASLGQAVISNRLVPARIRQTLNIESGLNDGIAMPFLLMAVAFVTAEEFGRLGDWIRLGLIQIGMGTLAGLAIGFLAARFLTWGARSGWMTGHFRKISAIALALLGYLVAVMLGGNGFIAAFVVGATSSHLAPRNKTNEIFEHVEVEVDLLILLTFMIVFGAVMLPAALRALSWQVVAYAVVSLTLVRLVPVAISLIGTDVRKETTGFLGWFGPRGTASILYLFTVIEAEHVPGMEIVYAATLVTVLISVFAHGITAAPGARWYGRIMTGGGVADDAAEVQPIPAMPERGPRQAE